MASAIDGSEWCLDGADEYPIPASADPSIRLVQAVAETTDRAQEMLRPLNDVVDPDALDALLSDPPPGLVLRLEYEGCVVCTDGRVLGVRQE